MRMDDSPLRIVFWNADGLSQEKARLLRLLIAQQRTDIVLLNETHLKSSDKVKVPGYIIYREDHTSPAGTAYRGLAVLVKRNIVHQPLPAMALQSAHALGVEICINRSPIRVFAFYRPPGVSSAVGDVHALVDSPNVTVIAGDFNARHTAWNSNYICTEGRRLLDDADRTGYEVLGPEVPTHYPYRADHIPDVIDLAVVRGLTAVPSIEVLDDHILSDHQPVLLTLMSTPAQSLMTPVRHRQDWELFAHHMTKPMPYHRIESQSDIDTLAVGLSAEISKALRDSKRDATSSRRTSQLPANILTMIERKRKLRRQWQQTRCPTMKSRLNALAVSISAALATVAAESWERTIEHSGDDWSALHRLCRRLSGRPAPIRPLLAGDGTPRYRAEDRAEIFADHLERQFQPNAASNMQHVEVIQQRVESYFREPIAITEDPVVLSPGQVQRVIRRTKLRKAPGPDGISNEALRHLPPHTVARLTQLFNGILRFGYFPDSWKLGRIIMLPKPGKNVLKPESYRPITLLSTISKVFEKLLLLHLRPHIEPRDEQFGFRAEHSTTHQLARVLHHFAVALNKREQPVAVLLDMEKAFDRVWHTGLIYKLSTSTTPRRVVKTVASFLRDRRFQVVVDGTLSTERKVKAGVPQGSCLSPVCYNRYTDDIPTVDGVTLALYADDAAYVTSSMSPAHAVGKMQRVLDALPQWLEDWRLTVNVAKTQALFVGQRLLPPPLLMLGNRVEWAPTVKYLGVTIDRRLSMAPHVRNIIGQARAARALLRPVLTSRLPLRTKLGVYKAYIRSRLTYAAPAWYALVAESRRKELRAQQALAIRALVNAPRFVRNATISRDLNVESLDDFIGRMSAAMFRRTEGSINPQIRGLAPYHRRPPDRWALPRDLVPQADSPG